jgi:hypothetical protein
VDNLVEGGSEQLSEDIETGVKRDTAEVWKVTQFSAG